MICHSQLALSPQETAARNEKSFKVKRFLKETHYSGTGTGTNRRHFEGVSIWVGDGQARSDWLDGETRQW